MPVRLAVILLVTAAAGCGQSGPLYLPGDPSRITTELPERPAEEPEDDEEEDDADDTP